MLTALHRLLARVRAFFTAGDLDRDLRDELQSHLDMLTDENVRRGMTPAAARRAAAIRLGAASSLTEQHRDVRGLPAFDALVQDLRFAWRQLARDRWYAATAIGVLALGIGANAAGFAVINAAFWRSLPYEDADRLYALSWQSRAGRRSNVSYSEFQDWRAASRGFTGLAAYRTGEINISGDRALPEHVTATAVSANAFALLGQPPMLGRDFTAADETPGADPVVLIGHDLWKRRYAGDASVLGGVLRVNGRPATIIGVMPEGMKFPETTDAWTPLIPVDAETQRDARVLRVFGRVSPATARRQAHAEMNAIAARLIAAYPETSKDIAGIRVETFSERFIGGAGRTMFLTMMGAVVLVLLIACANVANLLLSRSTGRAREIAVRMALGATRGRIIRQLLLESAVLSVISGGLGLLLAAVGIDVFATAMQESGLPYWVRFQVDGVVFTYVAAISMAMPLVFGLAPAWQASGRHSDRLKEGAKGYSRGPGMRRFGTAMVLTEITLTTMLLVAAGLMIRSFVTLYSADLGIPTDGLVTMRLRLPDAKYRTPDARREFFALLESRLAAIPGVEGATVTNGVPPHDGGERLLETDRSARSGDSRPVFVGTVAISKPFFEVVGVSLVRGRNFQETDGAPGMETVIINQRLAAQFFPGEDPIGRRLRFVRRESAPGEPQDAWRTIVGIAPTIKHGSPQDGYENAVVYIPYRQETPAAASVLVRSPVPAEGTIDAVRREVQALDPDQPVWSAQTMAQVLAESRWWWRLWGAMFGVFAAIALVLSAVGLYAVIAYSVAQRTREIGVRMALGAERLTVCWMVLKQGLVRLAIGLTVGHLGALVLSDVLWSGGMIVTTPWDPITYASITMLMALVAIAASLSPARRATRIDPVVALRAE